MRRNDLISKAEVLETYAELYDIFDDNAAIREELHKVYAKINNLKELEAGQQWISVRDGLPERSGEGYIVYITSNDGEKCVTCDHLICSSRKHWFLFDGAEAVVTHWMPLPKSPKEN